MSLDFSALLEVEGGDISVHQHYSVHKDMSSIALQQQHHSKHFAHREECDKNIQQISIANNQSKGPPKVRS